MDHYQCHRHRQAETRGQVSKALARRALLTLPLTLAAVVCGAATGANADPCRAQLPKPGVTFTGAVRYVGDGDSLCVGASSDPRTWIEVRLADFYAPELAQAEGAAARRTLARIAEGRLARCIAGHQSYDRVVARCSINGVSIGELLSRQGVREGGRGTLERRHH